MKARFSESFRMRIMLYTCIALLAALISDGIILMFCIRSGLFVHNYDQQVEQYISQMYIANNYQGSRTSKSLIGQTDVFYRIFGVSIQWQLVVLLVLSAIIIFLLTFFLLTRQMTGYIENIMDGARRMSNGDFNQRIEVHYQDEFSCIADCINQMADTVEEMQQSKDEAEQTKNELITNVAHDLRTPLTSIIGYIDIVNSQKELPEEKKSEYLQIAWEKAHKLENLINELFSFTKVSYSKMPMQMAEIDLIKLLEQEVDELYPAFEEKHLTCYFEADVSSCTIQADGEQLVRVFDNLLGNAIRYGKDGKIIRVKTKTGERSVTVQIINYGSIIPEENLPYLFDKFYKVDTARQSSAEGTGLGLAIAKSIVDGHGGRITATSSFEGTVFEVTLFKEMKEEKEGTAE